MTTSPTPPESRATSPSASATIAHDVFNLLTVLYGHQDDLDGLPPGLSERGHLIASAKGIVSRLEEIGRLLVALSHAQKQG